MRALNSRKSSKNRAANFILGVDMETSYIAPHKEDLTNILRGLWVDQMLGITQDVNAYANKSFEDKLGYLPDNPAPVPHFRRAVA